jgi:hypothetical protein
LASENDSRGLTTSNSHLTEEYLAWGIRKNDIEQLHSANRFIDFYKREGKLNSIISGDVDFIPCRRSETKIPLSADPPALLAPH